MAEFEFEDILPFVEGEGDTGKTAREKINRNFTKIEPLANVGAEMQQLRQDVAEDLEQLHDDVEEMVDKTTSLFGYYNCSTAGATAAKTVQATNYELTTGGNIRIKMEHANTAERGVILQIGSAAANDLYYNGEPVSPDNTWEDGETIVVYYDGEKYLANSLNNPTINVVNNLAIGGEGSALSAEMGKLIKNNVQAILNALGEYAFPNGKPQVSWPVIYDSEVEYLQSSGTQVIDSGVGGNLETDITIKFRTLSTIGVAVLGSRGTNTESIQIYVANGGTQRFGYGNVSVSFSANTDYTVNFNKTKMTVNGTNYNINTSTAFTTPTNIFFFGSNSAKGSFKISSVQIKQNGALVRDFIPVRVGTTGYMYDNVTEQLYPNAGTGNFILGNDKNA